MRESRDDGHLDLATAVTVLINQAEDDGGDDEDDDPDTSDLEIVQGRDGLIELQLADPPTSYRRGVAKRKLR